MNIIYINNCNNLIDKKTINNLPSLLKEASCNYLENSRFFIDFNFGTIFVSFNKKEEEYKIEVSSKINLCTGDSISNIDKDIIDNITIDCIEKMINGESFAFRNSYETEIGILDCFINYNEDFFVFIGNQEEIDILVNKFISENKILPV